MTKLYIDDLRNSPDDSWIVARTITGAIRVLATMDVDVISLDHDMSHHVSVDGNARPFACIENFSAVCYFIGEKYLNVAPTELWSPCKPHKVTLPRYQASARAWRSASL
jgi:hypothetical protein